jgi:predicted metalloprotease with PDZ domain
MVILCSNNFLHNDKMIQYTITLNTKSQEYLVELQFVATKPLETLQLPVWIPGSYCIRDFSKHIIKLQAYQNNKSLICQEISKNCWQLDNLVITKEVKVIYIVFAGELGIRSAYLDQQRGYFNNTSICISVVGQEQQPHTIKLSSLPTNWQVATSLTQSQTLTYKAANYNILIDSPFELGNFHSLLFKVDKTPFKMVISGELASNFNSQKLIKDVQLICTKQMQLFNNILPFKEYLFILHLNGDVYTGLEHTSSTLLMAPYYSVPVKLQKIRSPEYIKLLSLISHEFFHSWNVKSIKPQAFIPYNLYQENYTQLLWWFEGITSYYDDLILYRANIISKKEYLQNVLDNINEVYKYSGVTMQTLTQSSITAWIKYYQATNNSPNVNVNYYQKGALIGLMLDLLIRYKSNYKYSLDSVMNFLYKKWCNDQHGIGEQQLQKLIYQSTQCNLDKEIKLFINTTKPLPLKPVLNNFGIQLYKIDKQRQSDSGKVVDTIKHIDKTAKYDLGAKLIKQSIGYLVKHVYSGGIANENGIIANDQIIAIDSILLNDFTQQLALYSVNDKIKLTIIRQHRLMEIEVVLKVANCAIHYLQIVNTTKLNKWL